MLLEVPMCYTVHYQMEVVFTFYINYIYGLVHYILQQETRSPHPVKLSVVDEEENKVVDDLRDFVALNLLKLVSKEVEGEIRPG